MLPSRCYQRCFPLFSTVFQFPEKTPEESLLLSLFGKERRREEEQGAGIPTRVLLPPYTPWVHLILPHLVLYCTVMVWSEAAQQQGPGL